jgi:hypothetical protein
MKHFLLFCGCLVFLLSCKDRYDDTEGYFLDFRPRKCSFLCITPGQTLNILYEGITFTDYKDLDKNYIVKNYNLFIAIQTSNQDIREGRDYIHVYFVGNLDNVNYSESIPTLEHQIEQDYKQRNSSQKTKGQLNNDLYENLIPMEYRITGIRNLQISATVPLFGKTAGESLNDFFDIIRYDPQIIASSQTHNLLMGFSTPADELPRSIDEWLSLQPLAQTNMYFQPNTPLGIALPADVRLAIEMETEEGLVLRDTTAVFTITE